jgi:hypothetical protein
MDDQQMPQRIEIVYRDALDNISFTKKQQWIVAGYALSVHVATLAIWKQAAPSVCLRILLTAAIVLAALYGVVVLVGFAQGLDKWRGRLRWIYDRYFDGEERDGLKLGARPPYTEWVFIGGLSFSLLGSAIIALVLLWS